MASKYSLITQLYRETVKSFAGDIEEWKRFLTCSVANYKLRFDEQVLLFAQKPDAKAVATIDVWNKRFIRWVNRGAKGIAVFDGKAMERQRLKYYFDISDTHEREGYHVDVPIWEMKPGYEDDVIETLEATFGELYSKENLSRAILSAAENAAEDNLSVYVDVLSREKSGSYLESLDEDNLTVQLRDAVSVSVAYMLMERLGQDGSSIPYEDFLKISDFNTEKTMIVLGFAVSDISQMALTEIARTIKSLDSKNRTFEQGKEREYNGENEERSLKSNDENRISNEERLSDPEHRPTETGRSYAGSMGEKASEVSSGKRPDNILQPADGSEADRTFGRDGEAGRGDDGAADEAAHEGSGDNGAAEGEGYVKLGRPDEQPEASGGGGRDQTDHSGLTYYDRRTEDHRLPFFGEDNLVNQLLKENPHLKATKEEIRTYFSAHTEKQERINYVRSLFAANDDEFILNDSRRVGCKPYVNVLHMWEGPYLSRRAEAYYDWSVIAEHFDSMQIMGELYDETEKPPALEGQMSFIEAEPAKVMFPQAVIDYVLAGGSNIEDSKFRIYEQFEKGLPTKENIEFLKDEYGWGGRAPIKPGLGINEMHDGKGIHLSRGFADDAERLTLTWREAEKRIAELIRTGRYLKPEETARYGEWRKEREEKTETNIEEKEVRQTESKAEPPAEPSLKSHTHSLGDKVYIGSKAYEIISITGDEVKLYDPESPLIPETLSRDTFEERYAETPANREKLTPVSEEEKRETEPVIPKREQTEKEKGKGLDGQSDILKIERHNFDLKANPVETVGKKERFRRNLMAIQLLKTCQEENRFATPDEQAILSQYVGWGGIPEAFDENNAAWGTEYLELKTVLTPEEYTAARESTLTAFYTPPAVISAIYKAIESMGFEKGNILEPSCGIGNFMGMLPEKMRESRLYGIELDPVSGNIARQLYQEADIKIAGYEKTELSDSFFDVAVGNVPFGDFKVLDKRYDKHNFLIHDYFFAKTIDKVRPGGIIAFITSKGTMDKANPQVRKYLAQRAELIGAIRLPNNAFKSLAGTEVTSDILFLQKRETFVLDEPEWVFTEKDENGIEINSYFVSNPDMILGDMQMKSGRFGMESACVPYPDRDLESLLGEAISNLHAQIALKEMEEIEGERDEEDVLPADPSVRNFSYTEVDGRIYFRENSVMLPISVSKTAEERIKGLIALRKTVRELIDYQREDFADDVIKEKQAVLNQQYDDFTKKYGLINSRANSSAFSEDSSYFLLCALEILDEDHNLLRKADMFSKRTIRPNVPITSADTAAEALALSIAEKAKVDMEYMMNLTGKNEEEITDELAGVIFLDPQKTEKYEDGSEMRVYTTADEYLSGNIREKLRLAEKVAEADARYVPNTAALKGVLPQDLTASEIDVRLGATWLPTDVVEDFIFELLGTPNYARWNIKVMYSDITGEWRVTGKSHDRGNVKAYSTYGTNRINAYKIIENTLNLRDVRVFDYVYDENGKKTPVLNKKETAIAKSKQQQIKQAFVDWIWNTPERRERLTRIYNDKFNAMRAREYDGSHIHFVGMNPEIKLKPHQVNAVARILYGGNTLLAHAVGAGKTFEMVAAAMESKRLGLCNKSLFVVPNHLTEQWASEFLQLYPAANILVTTKKDFEKKNRKRFCGRIATGDFDAIIMGHSQFEKIPVSVERQVTLLQNQIDEITEGVVELKESGGERFSIKQLEKMKKSLTVKLEKLNAQERKDDMITFEELGVDRLFVDESHYYKNLFLYTKMRNVGGIAQTEAQKSSDMFMKCRYLDEITGGKGIVFATGTPISNSMVELYTVQRYLQYDLLLKNHLQHFDAWASTFGETVTAVELSPEGTGYRSKTRFARFYNLPELMTMVKEAADIQTADMLKLPVPKAEYITEVTKATEMQKKMVEELADRAERVRNKMVDSSVDNMLLITNDGRKLALDQRLVNDMLPDSTESKVNKCIDNIYTVWEEGKADKLAQLVFCDLSTPKADGRFNVYDDIRAKLIKRGVPEEEIAFIHRADSEAKKKELFAKVRSGNVRVLLGSTQKMGAGTNVQDRLIAMHDLDCPWRPSDVGRILRTFKIKKNVEVTDNGKIII